MLLPASRIVVLSVCIVLSLLPPGGRSAAVTVTLAPPTNTNQTETLPSTTSSVQGRSAALTSTSISAQNVHEKRSISLLMPLLGSLTSGLLSSLMGGGGGGDRGGGGDGYSNGASGLGGGLIGLLGSLLSSRVGLGGGNFRPINDDGGGLYGSASSPNSYSANGYSSNSGPGMDFSLDLGKLSHNLRNGFRLGKAAGSAGGRFLGNILTSAGGALQGFQGNHGGGQQQQYHNGYNNNQQQAQPPKVEVYEAAPAGYHQQPMFVPAPQLEYGYPMPMPQPQPYLYGNDDKAPAQVTFPSDNYLYDGRVADKGNRGNGAIRYNDYDSDTRDKYQQQQQYRQPSTQTKGQNEYQAVAGSSSGNPYKVVVNRGNANSDSSNRQPSYRGQTTKDQSEIQYDTSSTSSQVATQSGYGDNGASTNNGYAALAYDDSHQSGKQPGDSFGSSDSMYEQGETQLYPQVMFPTGPVYNIADVNGQQATVGFDGQNYVLLNRQGEFHHQDE